MNTIRAFIAVEIDPPNKQKLSELISKLKRSNADIKWATENQMHLTLKFLGNIQENKIRDISLVLKSITDNVSEFYIRLSAIGTFPNMKRPRVIWMGIDNSRPLKALSNKIETELEKIGTQRENREYKAHFTLGRVRTSKNIPGLMKLLNEVDFCSQDEIKIDKIILFQSTLTPKGAIYTPLITQDLRKG
ncbi:RNA 2',3'-cyclic phosphodiesterase [Candidatus Omnitrophota bacterium]